MRKGVRIALPSMVDGLALLPVNVVYQGIDMLYKEVLDNHWELLEYFDRIYVCGSWMSTRTRFGTTSNRQCNIVRSLYFLLLSRMCVCQLSSPETGQPVWFVKQHLQLYVWWCEEATTLECYWVFSTRCNTRICWSASSWTQKRS